MGARKNPDHAAGRLIRGFKLAAIAVEPDEDFVSVHGDTGVLSGDIDIPGGGQFRDDESKPFFTD